MDISWIMVDHPILDIALLVLFLIGYVLVTMSLGIFVKHEKRVLKRYKALFLISQGAALLLVLFMMTTERNHIALLGYLFLLAVSAYSGITILIGLIVPPRERSHTGKKLLKLSKWTLCIGSVLTIAWAMIWWNKVSG